MAYRTTISLSDENRRFLARFVAEARQVLGKPVSSSSVIEAVITRYREEVERREPKVPPYRHERVPVQDGGSPDEGWMQAATELLLRSELSRSPGVEQEEGS